MADTESPETRPAASRKRASKACLACRARKVRCDVAQRSTPCTNCFLDKQKCVVKPRPTKYKASKSKGGTSPVESETYQTPLTQEESQMVTDDRDNNSYRQVASSHGSRASEPFPNFHVKFGTPVGETTSDQSVEEMERDSPDEQVEGHIKPEAFECSDSAQQIDVESRSTIDTHVIFSYYPFLELDILSHMSSQDVNFLEQAGCFRVPARPALDAFIVEYFLHVHPCLPIIDEGEFWENFSHRGNLPADKTRLSLFVFQAMMFASCSFVPLEIIRTLGFTSARSARGTYYRRAKLLFDFNGERDLILTAQGALLLSFNSSMRSIKRVNTFWVSIGIQFAKDAGAHRYHTKQSLTPQRRNALKRLWWCCIIRDRILPLGVRRPLQISSLDFDFAAEPLTKEDFEYEITRSQVYDVPTKHSLTELFLTLCGLCVMLTDVILLAYPLGDQPDNGFTTDVAVEQALNRVAACKSGLNSWFEKATLCFPTPAGLGDMHKSVILYTNLMYMYYHSAILAIYNHEIFVLATRSKQEEAHWGLLCQSKRQLEEGTAAMTENLKELIQLKLSKYMPISVVAYAALPLVLHLLDVKLSSSPAQLARKQGRLNIYTEAMKSLKSQYDGTDELSGFIGRMIEYVSLEKPPPGAPQADNAPADSRYSTTWLRSGRSATPVSDWSDVLLRQPNLYTRLIMTIDLSLARGRFPDDTDFPMVLQSKTIFGPRFPLYRISMAGPPNATPDSGENVNSVGASSEISGNQLDSQGQHPQTEFSTPNFSANGFPAQMQNGFLPTSGSQLNGDMDMPMYLGGLFDINIPEGTASMLDNPTWGDGMFSEVM